MKSHCKQTKVNTTVDFAGIASTFNRVITRKMEQERICAETHAMQPSVD